MLSANINLVVPELPQSTVWFANAAAWSNYWKNINVTVTFDPAVSLPYVPVNYDATLNYERINVDGVNHDMPSLAQFLSFLTDYQALRADYAAKMLVLKNAGYITEA